VVNILVALDAFFDRHAPRVAFFLFCLAVLVLYRFLFKTNPGQGEYSGLLVLCLFVMVPFTSLRVSPIAGMSPVVLAVVVFIFINILVGVLVGIVSSLFHLAFFENLFGIVPFLGTVLSAALIYATPFFSSGHFGPVRRVLQVLAAMSVAALSIVFIRSL